MVTDAGAAGDGRQGRDRKARVEAERRMRTGAEHGRAAASWMSHGGDDGKRSNESSEQCRRERLQPGLHQPPLLPLQGRRQALMLPLHVGGLWTWQQWHTVVRWDFGVKSFIQVLI